MIFEFNNASFWHGINLKLLNDFKFQIFNALNMPRLNFGI